MLPRMARRYSACPHSVAGAPGWYLGQRWGTPKRAGFSALKTPEQTPESTDPGIANIVVYTLISWGSARNRRPLAMSEVSATGAALRGLASRLVGRPVAIDRTADRPAPARPNDRASSRPSDRVELSDRARFLAKLHQVPPVRQGLIDEVRAQIESGMYDTPEKFGAALDGLIEDSDLTA